MPNYLLGKLRSSRTLMTSSDLRRPRKLALPPRWRCLGGRGKAAEFAKLCRILIELKVLRPYVLFSRFWVTERHSDRSGSRRYPMRLCPVCFLATALTPYL